jgi:thiol:disulfide interchange protein
MRFPAAIMAGCVVALASWVLHASAEVPPQSAEVKLARITLRIAIVPNDPFDPGLKAGSPMKVRRGQIVKLVVEGELKPKFHTFPLIAEQKELWDFLPRNVDGLAFAKTVSETPAPEMMVLPIVGTRLGHAKGFRWEQNVLVLPDAKPGPLELPVKLRGLICDDQSCAPISQVMKVGMDISSEEALPVDPLVKETFKPSSPAIPDKIAAPPVEPKNSAEAAPPRPKGVFGLIDSTEEQYSQSMDKLAERIVKPDTGPQGNSAAELLAFMLSGVFWGAISLVTPCVFPMIPITVSIFLKQSEKEHHRPVTMALVYSGTIVIVLTLAATFMLSVFRYLSVNPIMNYALGGLFIYFALSLFGMYEIELPSGLARFTSAHESKGGHLGIIFMALTFTIISFACVAPFLGGFGGTAAGTARPIWHNLLGGLAFSVTFAAPFFFLALFPTLLRKMPKSGSWLNSVKVVMGFLELAAACKFCRAAELVLTGSEPWLITFDFALGIYVALSFLCGLYLLGIFRLPHDSPEEHLSVPRLVFAGIFIAFGFYLAPSLTKDPNGDNVRPRGTLYSWVESFLLPDANDSGNEELHTADLNAAVERALKLSEANKQPQRIFVDFTGVNCTNCKINEKSVFTKHSIRELFDPYILVKIFTDQVPTKYYSSTQRASFGTSVSRQKEDADVNLRFQRNIFNDERLPLYVILEPQQDGTIRVVGVYDEGRINNEGAFAKFLRDPK